MNNYYKEPKPAILIIDMLNAYFDKTAPLYSKKDKLVKNINELVDYAHSKNIPVIWVRQEYKKDLSDAPINNKKNRKLPTTIEGEDSSQILNELHYDDDYVVVKKRYSPFFNTNLEQKLKSLGINTIVVAGVNSMTCIRAAVNDAYQMDYEVILALNCVEGYDKEQHDAAMKYMQYSQSTGMTNSEIIDELGKINDSNFVQ